MKNNSKIAAKKAVPGGVKADASFTKRSGAPQKQTANQKGPREEYGPRTAENIGAGVSDDKAGTRSKAWLPPQTTAMASPAADVPAVASDIASPVLPVPSADTPLLTVTPWDYARDAKFGRAGS